MSWSINLCTEILNTTYERTSHKEREGHAYYSSRNISKIQKTKELDIYYTSNKKKEKQV